MYMQQVVLIFYIQSLPAVMRFSVTVVKVLVVVVDVHVLLLQLLSMSIVFQLILTADLQQQQKVTNGFNVAGIMQFILIQMLMLISMVMKMWLVIKSWITVVCMGISVDIVVGSSFSYDALAVDVDVFVAIVNVVVFTPYRRRVSKQK